MTGATSSQYDQAKVVLDLVLRDKAQEFQITERLDSKARNQATLAGAWFAAAQVVAINALGDGKLASEWVALVVFGAACAAVSLALLFWKSREVWGKRDEAETPADAFILMLRHVEEPDVDIVSNLVRQEQAVLKSRRANNKLRADALGAAERIWLVVLGSGLAELIIALAARAYG